MITARQLLASKGRQVWSVGPDATVLEALRLMAHKDVGALLVLDEGTVVGVVSERDYARKVILEGRASRDTPVSQIMTRAVLHALPEQSVADCMAIMTAKKVRHLPVMDQGELMGIISIGDLVKSIIAEQESVIEQLANYISGSMA